MKGETFYCLKFLKDMLDDFNMLDILKYGTVTHFSTLRDIESNSEEMERILINNIITYSKSECIEYC